MYFRVVSLALLGALMGSPGTLWAGPSKTARERELEERIERLEEIIRSRGLDKPAPAGAPAVEAVAPVPTEEVEALIDDKLKKQKVLSMLSYQAGVGDGVQDGGSVDGDVNNGKELVGRVFGFAFKETDLEYLKGLGFGLAGTYGPDDGGNDVTNTNYRTSERVSIFKYAAPKNTTVTSWGNRNRLDPQMYYFWGPFGLQAEYIRSHQGVEWTGAQGPVTDRQFTNTGWYAQASYVLTGEDASYNGVVPINNFDPRNGRCGAFEIALRGSKLSIDDDAFKSGFADLDLYPSETSEITAGVNWYLNKNVKFQLNYANTAFDHGVEIGDAIYEGVNSFQLQFQIGY